MEMHGNWKIKKNRISHSKLSKTIKEKFGNDWNSINLIICFSFTDCALIYVWPLSPATGGATTKKPTSGTL